MVKTQKNNTALYFFAILSIVFVTLAISLLIFQLPENTGFFALFKQSDSLDLLLIQSYSLTRICIALLAGGILGFASLLLQQVMNNPLASDNTLGINSGAQLALFLTAIFAPNRLEFGSSLIATLGAAISLTLVLCLSWRKTMSPLLLILAGLVVNLYFGALSALMMLFYPEESRGLAQWGAGSLVQESWRDTQWLFMQAVPVFVLIGLLIRPFSILSLNDSNAVSLGVPVTRLRIIGVLAASFLIAAVVSAVGMLGFIGLASATIVCQLGVRHFRHRLILSFVSGALLLAITDLVLQFLSLMYNINLPTGAVTALLGTPLLLWLMFKALPNTGRLTEHPVEKQRKLTPHFTWLLFGGLAAACFIALNLGQNGQQWYLNFPDTLREIFDLRYPRVLGALSVGILLAVAGVLLQRLTLNPMASPELLGVSSGCGIGILAVLFLTEQPAAGLFWIAGVLGALITLAIIAGINQRNGMLPEKVLLTGITLSALFDTLQRLVIAGGDPRAIQLIAWTSGSTQQIHADFALIFCVISLVLLACALIFSRWLEILALQAPMAQSLGLNIIKVRWILILFSALLTAVATLIIGPLSFIGLLVPHLARTLGACRARSQLPVAALLGGMIMVLADWLGRQLLFPYEIPAGLVATLIGGGYFLLMMRKI
ncbi:Fe(3+)-hydroxamate ABC transporter permease FhuB [Pasteurellaceae bacterium LIM206]|nr:Fe(3+)-hydroxamate ABC transporter permease FhuB [Pasteurellaceae bacterium LIM206]